MISFENYNKMVKDLKEYRKSTGDNSSETITHFIMTRLNEINEEEVQQPVDVEELKRQFDLKFNWSITERVFNFFLPYLQQPAPAKKLPLKKDPEALVSMLEDVVTVLDLSDAAIEKHGPLGTAPADLVRLVLEEKHRTITILKAGIIMFLAAVLYMQTGIGDCF